MTAYHGQPAPGSLLAQLDDAPAPRAKRQSPEYAEQRGVLQLYQSIGASVYVNSVYGAQPHGVTPGIADCRIKHTDWRLEWEHETKPAKRRQSKAQHEYLTECRAMGTVYVLGGVSLIKRRDRRSHPPRDNWDRRRIRKTVRAMERFSEALARGADSFAKWSRVTVSSNRDA